MMSAMKGRKLRLTALVFSLAALLLVLGVYLLLATEVGNRYLLKQVHQLEPRFSATLVRGNVLSKLELGQVSWHSDTVAIELKHLSFSWDWSCLYQSRLCLKQLATQGLELTLMDAQQSTALNHNLSEQDETIDEGAQWLSWPLEFAIDDLELLDTQLDIFGEQIGWQRLSSRVDGQNLKENQFDDFMPKAKLEISEFELEQLNLVLSAVVENKPLKANLKQIELPEVFLPFELIANQAVLTGLQINQEFEPLFAMEHIGFRATMVGTQVQVESLTAQLVQPGLGQVSGELVGSIELLQGYPLSANIHFYTESNEILPALEHAMVADGSVKQLSFTLNSMLNMSQQSARPDLGKAPFIIIAGQLQPLEHHLPFSTKLQWQNLRWPFIEAHTHTESFDSKKGWLEVSGNLQKFVHQSSFELRFPDLPQFHLASKGEGGTSSLTFDYLELKSTEGTLNLNGQLDWQQGLSWHGALDFNQLNLSRFIEPLEKDELILEGRAETEFVLNSEAWSVALTDILIQGEWMQSPVKLLADIKGKKSLTDSGKEPFGAWSIKQFQLLSEQNKFAVSGQIAEHLALEGTLDFAQLGRWLPLLRGKAKGEFQLSGLVVDPALNYQLELNDLNYQISSLDEKPPKQEEAALNYTLSLDLLRSKGTLHPMQWFLNENKAGFDNNDVEILIQGAKGQGQEISDGLLTLTGDISKHELQLELQLKQQNESYSFHTKVKGGLRNPLKPKWFGEVKRAKIQSPIGPWRLLTAIAVDYNILDKTLNLGEHCWRYESIYLSSEPFSQQGDAPASLCLKKFQFGKQRELEMNLIDFPLFALNQRFHDEAKLKQKGRLEQKNGPKQNEGLEQIELDGLLSGKFELNWPEHQKPKANMALAVSAGKITILERQNRMKAPYVIPFDLLALSAQLTSDKLSASLDIGSSVIGSAHAYATVFPYIDKRPIKGRLQLSNLPLDKLLPLLPQLDQLGGAVMVDVSLSGELASPSINGQVKLHDISMSGTTLALKFEQINGTVDFDGVSAQMMVKAVTRSSHFSNDGHFSILAKADWEPLPLTASLSLTGQDIEFSHENIKLQLAPDLQFDLRKEQMQLTGRIFVPRGLIKMQELPKSAVAQSQDVIVIKQGSEKKKAALPFAYDLQVNINDDVEIDAFGLKSNLEGSLALKQVMGQTLIANGEISLKEGTYKAWGQNLVIEQGQLVFSGAIDKPFLNINAIRNPNQTQDGVTAGVRMKGAASHPEVEIYSEPAMAQQEAISYLIRGRGLSSGSDKSNDNAVAMMLLSFGLGQGEGIVSSIGDNLGVSNLSLEATERGEDTVLEVRAYILPGVEVGYGVSLITNLPQVTLKYELLPKLYIEGVSGVESALDLLYEFEL